MTDATNNVFAPAARTVAASTVAFIDANKAADGASTPFARSTLAAVMGGLSSRDMVESLIIAAFGSPTRENGKPVGKVSQLRDFDGGARLYQAWKDISFILDNLDADAPANHDNAEGETAVIGTGDIRRIATDFVLQNDGAVKALFGRTGLTAAVKGAMAAHNEAIAAHNGVAKDAEGGEGEGEPNGETVTAVTSLADRINTLAVAWKGASDDDRNAVKAEAGSLAALLDGWIVASGDEGMMIEYKASLAA